MKYMSEQITALLGFGGFIMAIFTLLGTNCDCLLPSYLFFLIHIMTIFTAFPFLIHSLFKLDQIDFDFIILITLISVLNGVLISLLGSISGEYPGSLLIIGLMEFFPIFLIVIRLPYVNMKDKNLPALDGLIYYYY